MTGARKKANMPTAPHTPSPASWRRITAIARIAKETPTPIAPFRHALRDTRGSSRQDIDSDNISRRHVDDEETDSQGAAEACIPESVSLDVPLLASHNESRCCQYEATRQHPGPDRAGHRLEDGGGDAEMGGGRYNYE